jgi:prepilin-type N-terminal cleavage/methylation domain-containing protein
MIVSSHSDSPTGRRNILRSTQGFSLIEMMVAATIVSMLFMAAVPLYQRIQRKARTAAVINDFQVFAAAFQAHAHSTGSWPPESATGVIPTGMNGDELKADKWTRTTPIGGQYDWENNQLHNGVTYRAAITIVGTTGSPLVIDPVQFLDIDRAIDDGDLTTGSFRLGFGNCPLFIIEP